MIPVISEVFGAILALVVGVVCVFEIKDTGYRLDFLLIAIISFAIVGVILKRVFQIVKEVRALLEDADH